MIPGLATPRLSGPVVLTATRSETLRSCPLRAVFELDRRFSHVHRSSISSVLGRAAHAVLEEASRARELPREVFEQGIVSCWTAAVDAGREELETDSLFGDVPAPARWPNYQIVRARALQAARDRLAAPLVPEHQVGVLVEEELTSQDQRFRGRIDRAEVSPSGVRIVDLKSADRNPEGMRPEHRRQVLFYAWLWRLVKGQWPTTAAIHYLDGSMDEIGVSPDEAKRTVEEAVRILEGVEDHLSRGGSAWNLAVPSCDHCRFCGYRIVCEPSLDCSQEEWWSQLCVVGYVTGLPGDRSWQVEVLGGNRPPGTCVYIVGVATHASAPEGPCSVLASRRLSPLSFEADWRTLVIPLR